MNTMLAIALVLVSTLCLSQKAVADEEGERVADQGAVVKLLDQKDFKSLNRIFDDLRASKELGPAGTPRLEHIYDDTAWYFGGKGDSITCPQNMEKAALEWQREMPESPAAIIMASTELQNKAWCARGQDYAVNVKPSAWPIFNAYLEAARKNLMDHKTVADVDPVWYGEMEGIAIAQGWSESDFNSLVMEAIRKHPEEISLYYGIANYYSPKWYRRTRAEGDFRRIEKFAEEQSAKQASIFQDTLYAKIYWHIFDSFPARNLKDNTQISWRHMKHSMDNIVSLYPDPWNIVKLARISCHSGDASETAYFLRKIDYKYVDRYWETPKEFEACVDLASKAR